MSSLAENASICSDGTSRQDDFLLQVQGVECVVNNIAYSVIFFLLAIQSIAIIPRVLPSIRAWPWKKKRLPSPQVAFKLFSLVWACAGTLMYAAKATGLKESDHHPVILATALVVYPVYNGPIVWLFLYLIFLPYSLSNTLSPAAASIIKNRLNKIFGGMGVLCFFLFSLIFWARLFALGDSLNADLFLSRAFFCGYTFSAASITLILGIGGIGLLREVSKSVNASALKSSGVSTTNSHNTTKMRDLQRRLVVTVVFICVNAAAAALLGILSLLVEPIGARSWLVFGLTMHVAAGGLHVALTMIRDSDSKRKRRKKKSKNSIQPSTSVSSQVKSTTNSISEMSSTANASMLSSRGSSLSQMGDNSSFKSSTTNGGGSGNSSHAS